MKSTNNPENYWKAFWLALLYGITIVVALGLVKYDLWDKPKTIIGISFIQVILTMFISYYAEGTPNPVADCEALLEDNGSDAG